MATVRIYKIAELLRTTSQEVIALLKRDHGITVKSASSQVDEVVAQQFVERLARQRGVPLPSGPMFARPEAPLPPQHQPPPRLVKRVQRPASDGPPDFEIRFAPDISGVEVKGALTALAEYYRACGGVGLKVDFELEEVPLRIPVDA